MTHPTTEQLNDPMWWAENAPEGATHGVVTVHGTQWYKDIKDEGDYQYYGPLQRAWLHGTGTPVYKNLVPRPQSPAGFTDEKGDFFWMREDGYG